MTVTLVMIYKRMESLALVYTHVFSIKSLYSCIYISGVCLQILMNVHKEQQVVIKVVTTLKEVLFAHVLMDIIYTMMIQLCVWVCVLLNTFYWFTMLCIIKILMSV